MFKQPWDRLVKAIAGLGALHVGLVEFVKFDISSFIPAGLASTAFLAVIGLSGAYVLWAAFKKQI